MWESPREEVHSPKPFQRGLDIFPRLGHNFQIQKRAGNSQSITFLVLTHFRAEK